jgi:hypothetical protein
MLCAFVCVPLGLKKPGDFTVSDSRVPTSMTNVIKTLTYKYVPPSMSYVTNMTNETKTLGSKHDWGTPFRTLRTHS